MCLFGRTHRIHGVTISFSAEKAFEMIDEDVAAIGLVGKDGEPVKATQLLEVVEGYVGEGYSLSNEQELSNWLLKCCHFPFPDTGLYTRRFDN